MERSFKRVRVVVVQPEEQIYFDRYYNDPLGAMDKFTYFPVSMYFEVDRLRAAE